MPSTQPSSQPGGAFQPGGASAPPHLPFDPALHPHPSRRSVVFAQRGMVATSHPLAADAGLGILKAGGNAIDAAIATAAALTVVEPTANGIGSDAFALVWTGGRLHGLNASGPAPMALSLEKVRALGHTAMPAFGWLPVTVPGTPAAWAELSRRFGRLPLRQVLAPAIELARYGHPLAPVTGRGWQAAARRYAALQPRALFQPWLDTFAPLSSSGHSAAANSGHSAAVSPAQQAAAAPGPGQMWSSVHHAETLEDIAETGAESFYRGRLARIMAEHAAATGGFLTEDDLAAFHPEWVDPISVRYRGYDVWEIPPNGQGIVALMALGMLAGDTFPARESADFLHLSIEAIKRAFAVAKAEVTDARAMQVTAQDLLRPSYLAELRAQIAPRATDPNVTPDAGGTVYLATADGEGNMVSFIQSNYMGFGSGIVVPGTGIALQNRGHTFSLEAGHINAIAPGKRTYHTIIPGFLTRDGHPIGPFGVMGGFMQPQGHLQVMQHLLDFHDNPQAALDAPRWQWMEGNRVHVERGIPAHLIDQLQSRGHDITVTHSGGSYGRGQVLWRLDNGVYAGGTEPRTDGSISAW
ncbi:MAG: gamma-glutamyltransferase family protein [Alicyclobacillaceae bacterium]|nr:gamma-glutamyltransferase family protein [Alicyclobacillaceae bacterium]